METSNHQLASAPVNDSAAERELEEFVAANRVVPSAPVRPSYEHLALVAESPEVAAQRAARDAERAEKRRRGEIVERGLELIRSAGERYRTCTLENFRVDCQQQRNVVQAVRDYIDADPPSGVVLYGPVGTGKDHLAFAVCRVAVRGGKTVRWINGQAWFGLVRDAMDTTKSEASLIADLARPKLLCLSDPIPPVGPLTQHQSTMIYRLVDARYSRGLPTICTINVSGDQEADERMGAATWDRLCHDAWLLNCSWPTYRKPARTI